MNLALLQLSDSALPIGGYSHSWGLEAAVDRGLVTDPLTLEAWTLDWLRFGLGPFEGVVVAAVCRDLGVLARANEMLDAGIAAPTLRNASRDMGRQLLALAEVWPWAERAVTMLSPAPSSPAPLPRSTEGEGSKRVQSEKNWHHAPVFAALAATAGATPREATAAFLHQAALGMIGAGVRVIPIGHTHGQQILARLHEALATLADELSERELETAGSSCPAYEVLCHAQSQLYTRLFRS